MKNIAHLLLFSLIITLAAAQTKQNNIITMKKVNADTVSAKRAYIGDTLQNCSKGDSALMVQRGAHIGGGARVDGISTISGVTVKGNPSRAILAITDTAQNTVNTTPAQTADTSAFNFSFTGTHKPLFSITGPTGGTVVGVDSNGNIGIGVPTTSNSTSRLEIVNANTGAVMILKGYAPSGTGSIYQGSMARGTLSNPLAVQMSDEIASFRGTGFNGSSFSGSRGTIDFTADTNWSATANGTALKIRLTPNNSTILTEVLRISNKGLIGIGTSIPTYKIDLRGNTTESKIHFCSTNNDDGGYLGSTGTDNVLISGGTSFDGTNWIAKSANSSIVSLNSGNIGFYTNTSLTAGNIFLPSEKIRIENTTGNIGIMVGKFTQYNSTPIEGSGIAAILDTVEKSNQSVSLSTTNFNNSNGTGFFRISYYLACSVSDASGASIVLNLSWNDGAGKIKSSPTVSFSSTNNVAEGTFVIRNNTGSVGYATSITGNLTGGRYLLSMAIEKLN